jgi:hypothetical protein
VLETVPRKEELKWRKRWQSANNTNAGQAHRIIWCAKLADGELAALGKMQRRTTIIHRTVRWCTGLSGEPTVTSANCRPRNLRVTSGPQQWSVGHTGLSGVHRTVSGAPIDPEDQWSDAPDLEGDHAPDSYSDCPVVHRTVRCTTRQKASLAFHVGLQRLLAALGL